MCYKSLRKTTLTEGLDLLNYERFKTKFFLINLLII